MLLRRVTAGKLSCVSAGRASPVLVSAPVTRPGQCGGRSHQQSPSVRIAAAAAAQCGPAWPVSPVRAAPCSLHSEFKDVRAPQPAQFSAARAGRELPHSVQVPARAAACVAGAAFMCSNLRLICGTHSASRGIILKMNFCLCKWVKKCTNKSLNSTVDWISPARWCSCLVAAGCTL